MKWRKWIAAAALLLGLCVLPVHAEPVDAVEKLLSPVKDGFESARLVCPQVLPQNRQGDYDIYFELEHLAQPDLWLEVTIDNQTAASVPLVSRDGFASAWVTVKDPDSTETLEISVLDRQGGQAVYQSAAVLLGFTDNLTFDGKDAVACTPTTDVSVLSKTAAVQACLPPGTEDAASLLYGQIVDQNGVLYGTASAPAVIGDQRMSDSRFDGIFKENPYEVLVQTLCADVQFAKLPEPGVYDLIFVDANGAEKYRFEKVVRCEDQPAVQLMGWTAVPGAGADYAEAALFLANGAPADFALELYCDGELQGKSTDFHVLHHDRASGGVYLAYPFRLETPLEAGQCCAAKISTEVPYYEEDSCGLEAVRAEAGTIYGSVSCFDSAYFANVLLKTTGFVPQRQYRAVLELDETKLAECLVTCDAQGWFDIAFLDDDGKPLAITTEKAYTVSLYRWENGGQWALTDRTVLQPMPDPAHESDRFYARAEGLPMGEIVVHDHLTTVNGAPEALALQLFGQRNQGRLPDFEETLSEKCTIADEEALLFSAQRYRAVCWQDGRVAGVEPNGYWVDARCMADYQIIPAFEIETMESLHGSIQLLGDGGTPVHHGDWLGFTEIYVHAVPDPGYVVDEILVSQLSAAGYTEHKIPIAGRAFLLAENAEVAVTFKPRQVETFAIDLQHNSESDTDGGTLHCSLEGAALGDSVTLTAQPKDGFWLMGLRVFETETGLEVPLQAGESANTWQFVMPGTPVTAEVTFRKKVLAQIITSYDMTAGSVTAPGSAWEGDTVTVTAKPYEGCTLESLWLVYELAGTERKENLLEHPGSAPDSYCFRVPGAKTLWIYPTFLEHRFAVMLPEPLPVGGVLQLSQETARPGSRISITVIPDEEYRLTEGSLTVCTADQQAILLTPSEKPMTWSFLMPWDNVQVSAAFARTAPEVTGVTVETQGADTLTISAQMGNSSAEVSLAAAFYDADGRLLGAALQPCADGAAAHNLTIAYVGKPAAGQLFLLKTDDIAPLCEAISLTLPQ